MNESPKQNVSELLIESTGLPTLIDEAGHQARERFIEFFTASIRNRGTRAVYANAVQQFLHWCRLRGVTLTEIRPVVVATYIEQLTSIRGPSTVKVHLAAIRRLFDFLVTGQIVPMNPAASVRGPKLVIRKGSTPVLMAEEARELLDSIDTGSIVGLRDRAIIGVMVYSFARVSATLRMNIEDYFQQQRRMWLRLHEKGGKLHDVPAHHNAQEYLDEFLDAASIREEKKGPIFRTVNRNRRLTLNRMHRNDALRMIKRRALAIGLPESTCNHTFRATGITAYLKNGGLLEHAQRIAAHESVKTTKLYDRTTDEISLDEIERIQI